MTLKRGFLLDALATGSVSLVRAGGAASSFAFTVLASSALGPADAGIFFVSITWAMALAIFLRWGASDLILMTFAPLARNWRRKALPAILARYLHNSLLRLFGLVLPVMLGLGLLVRLEWMAPARLDLVFIFALTLAMVMQQLLAAAVKAAGRPVQASLIEFCFITLFAIIAYLALRGWVDDAPMRGFETLYLAGALVSVLLLMAMKGTAIVWTRPFKPAAMGTTLRRSHSLAVIELSGFMATWAAFLLMPLFLPAHDVGIYNAALRIASLTQLITISVPSVFIPRLAIALNEGKWAEARRLTRSVKWVMALAGIILFAGVAIFGRWALGLFGAEFTTGYGALLILTGGMCGAMAMGPAGAMLNVMGQERHVRNVTILFGVTTIALSVPAMLFYGIIGAASITALSALASKIVLVVLERRFTKVWAESKPSA